MFNGTNSNQNMFGQPMNPQSGDAIAIPPTETPALRQHLDEKDYFSLLRIEESYNKMADSHAEQICQLEQRFRLESRAMTAERSKYIRKVPSFWSTCLSKHSDLSVYLEKDAAASEETVLPFLDHYLIDLEVIYATDERFGKENVLKFGKDGLVIKLEFTANPAFNDRFITKAFGKRRDEKKQEQGFNEGTQIQWKSTEWKENLTGKRIEDDDEDYDFFSFFGWFQLSNDERDKECGIDEDGMDTFSKAIVEDIWSTPLEWYELEQSEDENSSDESFDDETDSGDMSEDF